ncbi:MAG: TusE/DsrC/DsvC family sulfur relay protein [Longimicrobiales bacterium]|nr:TusE/DsrC/DsvC family sulfur relay protein [Longimicrobiales bacterium]
MGELVFHGKPYDVDEMGFLNDAGQWDEQFAEGMAPKLEIPGGLTEDHWAVIRYIRQEFEKTGDCPLVFSTCRANRLALRDLEALFPTGYLRGACMLAGITYRNRLVNYYGEPSLGSASRAERARLPTGPSRLVPDPDKIYRVDVFGFLVDPGEWDERFASNKAMEMKVPGGLSARHWEILNHLRGSFDETGTVPTVLECCRSKGIEMEELESLFPDGYQRGAVKLAGLCVRPRAPA